MILSSPRAKRGGPKGPRAESARAVTGRRCPQSGRGEDFLSRQPDFWVINENWGRMAKIGFFGQKPKFWAKKKAYTFGDSPCSGNDQKKLFKEKSCLCPNNQGGKCHFG